MADDKHADELFYDETPRLFLSGAVQRMTMGPRCALGGMVDAGFSTWPDFGINRERRGLCLVDDGRLERFFLEIEQAARLRDFLCDHLGLPARAVWRDKKE